MPLTDAEALRFGRNVLLPEIGLTGQERLRAAAVRIDGLGAVGSAAALYLAAAGVGTLELVDPGDVAPEDLTGTLFAAADVGTPRTRAAWRVLGALGVAPGPGRAHDVLIEARATSGAPLAVHAGAHAIRASAAPGPEALLAGALAATEAVKALLGIGTPLDREGLP